MQNYNYLKYNFCYCLEIMLMIYFSPYELLNKNIYINIREHTYIVYMNVIPKLLYKTLKVNKKPSCTCEYMSFLKAINKLKYTLKSKLMVLVL